MAFRLGAENAAAFDICAACAGFSYGVALANDIIRGGSADYVLVVGVEKLSDMVDPNDRGTAFIFGDGAGAVVIGPSDTPGIGPVVWGADGSQSDAITQDAPWDVLRDDPEHEFPSLSMNGQQVFRWAVFEMAQVAQQALDGGRHHGGRPRRLHPPPGQHADHRRDGEEARPSRHVAVARDIVRHRQHIGGLDPARHGSRCSRAARRAAATLALLIGFGAGLSYAAQVVIAAIAQHHDLHAPPERGHRADRDRTPRRRNSPWPTEQEILAGLAEIVNEVAGVPAADVQLDKSFIDDLDIDSLSMVEVVVAAEEKFDVKIPDDDVKDLSTVGDAVRYIAKAGA